MFGIPHGIFFVGIFRFRVRLEHLLELSGSVISLCDTHSDQELDFYDDVVLLYVIFKGMFLDNFIVWPFRGFTEFTSAVHPTPKVLG
jgi:hypothetical protein